MTGLLASALAAIEGRLHVAMVHPESDGFAVLLVPVERELERTPWQRSRVARERLRDLRVFVELLSEEGLPPIRRRLVCREALRICQSLRLLTGDAGNRWRAGIRGRAHGPAPSPAGRPID